jgi:hypothetical protein
MDSLGSDGPPELTGIETGVWLVHTRDSVYVVDFAARTLARRPILGTDFRSTDRVRPLRSVEICRIGEPAFWTIASDDSSTGFVWQTSSDVTAIERERGTTSE